jgi:hypothetical protein
MSSLLIAFLVGVGVAAWAYPKLAKSNGNANPSSNMLMAGIGGLIVFIILFSLLKLVLGI